MKHLLASFTAAVFLIAILLCAPLFGQYTTTLTMSPVDNTPNCNGTFSCLIPLGATLSEIKAQIDGTVWGLNSSHALSKRSMSSPTPWTGPPIRWQSLPFLQTPGGGSIMHISAAGGPDLNGPQIMALSNAIYPASNI